MVSNCFLGLDRHCWHHNSLSQRSLWWPQQTLRYVSGGKSQRDFTKLHLVLTYWQPAYHGFSLPPMVQVGDWGRLGEFNQSLVAEAMAFRADRLHPDFVLGMGDNFYPSRHLLQC